MKKIIALGLLILITSFFSQVRAQFERAYQDSCHHSAYQVYDSSFPQSYYSSKSIPNAIICGVRVNEKGTIMTVQVLNVWYDKRDKPTRVYDVGLNVSTSKPADSSNVSFVLLGNDIGKTRLTELMNSCDHVITVAYKIIHHSNLDAIRIKVKLTGETYSRECFVDSQQYTIPFSSDYHPQKDEHRHFFLVSGKMISKKSISSAKKIASRTSFIIPSEIATLELWDYQKIDGDVISVYVDGALVYKKLQLTGDKFILPISMLKSSEITICVINEGNSAPCTVRARIVEINKEFTLEARKNQVMKINLSKAH